jgi:hypothetical protein
MCVCVFVCVCISAHSPLCWAYSGLECQKRHTFGQKRHTLGIYGFVCLVLCCAAGLVVFHLGCRCRGVRMPCTRSMWQAAPTDQE